MVLNNTLGGTVATDIGIHGVNNGPDSTFKHNCAAHC